MLAALLLTSHKVLGEDEVGCFADDATVGHGCVCFLGGWF